VAAAATAILKRSLDCLEVMCLRPSRPVQEIAVRGCCARLNFVAAAMGSAEIGNVTGGEVRWAREEEKRIKSLRIEYQGAGIML